MKGGLSWRTVKVDFDAAKLKVKHRRNPLDALDHACCNGRKKQFGGIEGIWSAFNIGIKPDLRILAVGHAPVGICASRHDVIFEHLRNPGFGLPAALCDGGICWNLIAITVGCFVAMDQ
jgi:hypothetical protein